MLKLEDLTLVSDLLSKKTLKIKLKVPKWEPFRFGMLLIISTFAKLKILKILHGISNTDISVYPQYFNPGCASRTGTFFAGKMV